MQLAGRIWLYLSMCGNVLPSCSKWLIDSESICIEICGNGIAFFVRFSVVRQTNQGKVDAYTTITAAIVYSGLKNLSQDLSVAFSCSI